jgi:hypothetical protein
MESWELTSFKISRIVTESKLRSSAKLPNYSGELAVSFSSYPEVDLKTTSVYFKAPVDYIHNHIKSYGGKLNYQITYSGYEMEGSNKSTFFQICKYRKCARENERSKTYAFIYFTLLLNQV